MSLKDDISATPGWVLVLCTASFVLNSLFFATNLPEITDPDEAIVVRRALALGSGDLNPHFAIYPHLWLYLLFLAQGIGVVFGYAAGFFKSMNDIAELVFTDETYFFSLARLLTAAFGAGVVWLTWLLGRHISLVCAWVTSLSVALFASFVFQAHHAKPDTALVFFVLLCLIASIRSLALPASNWQSLWWPAICAGLATSTKYNGFVIFASVAVALLLQRQRQGWSLKGYTIRLLAAAAIAFTTFFLTSPFVVLDLPILLNSVRTIYTLAIAYGSKFDPFTYLSLVVTNQGILFLLAAIAGWALLMVTAWGRTHRSMAWILMAFALPYLVIIQTTDYKRYGYFLPLVPIVALGSGILVSRIADILESVSFSRPLLRRILLLALIVGLLIPSLERTIAVERAFGQETASKLAATWFKKNVPPGSTVIVDADAKLRLPPDRETVEQRMRLWERDHSAKARDLLRAYRLYLKTSAPLHGYRLTPTQKFLLNTFTLGYDSERDYDVGRLSGVRYVVAPKDVVDLSDGSPRSRFYEKVREAYDVLNSVTDPRGKTILILERR